MSLIIDTLKTSTITEELSDTEVEILASLSEVRDYDAGASIVKLGDEQSDNLYILAHGDIEVKLKNSGEESTIHILKPGDLAGIINFVGGTQSSAVLYAVGKTKVLSLTRAKFETLINSHPMIVYKVMRGVVRNVHGIVRRVNSETAELSNYIYRSRGRY
ncbi:MAG: cyclic nucleotide-binding domain-containing protein [Gallionella sp.]